MTTRMNRAAIVTTDVTVTRMVFVIAFEIRSVVDRQTTNTLLPITKGRRETALVQTTATSLSARFVTVAAVAQVTKIDCRVFFV